ncbi:HdeD family acid-resistance protein [Acetobacterium woodii]|uniref:Acid-resistance membrane protein n=1 Tax=Acetobacterium woodii (strain ATCC 29683 / DSM 1030 / JCM 2381 / KCTC 1655 / WB1) TaxID=931626 RepID=H6LB76_ACEWD|nr:DUF308 domain-containing protein [Acetobacterium woodii]AFA47628.1 hypothetical protein Awo_c08370 [Acetobacterium woodii DSM 1030]
MNDFLKMSKTLGIVVAILMVVLGALIFFAPMFAAQMIMWFFIIGLIIYGAFHIILFANSEIKNGWSLTAGIMATLLGILLIFSDPLSRASTLAFMLAFITLTTGMNQITAASVMKKQGSPGTGWLLASGIINVLLSIFFIFNPFVMLLGFGIIAGVYLIFGGIALFAECMSTHML